MTKRQITVVYAKDLKQGHEFWNGLGVVKDVILPSKAPGFSAKTQVQVFFEGGGSMTFPRNQACNVYKFIK